MARQVGKSQEAFGLWAAYLLSVICVTALPFMTATQTTDFMTAHWAELQYSLLGQGSNRIINGVRGFNWVVYDLSGKLPATIEWE